MGNDLLLREYTREDDEAKLFDVINPGALTDENWPGTHGSLNSLRDDLITGRESAVPYEGERLETYKKILLLMKEEIEQAQADQGTKVDEGEGSGEGAEEEKSAE